ncbi:FadR/GntR family transcriptional regulator [Advenella mimigardefordensis]|uniref:Transcriptional regulator, GntR family n=1 Tax=Advenella mimigardefordensis (strain DSM 17166 / LMG 22922 / DPN7) TaxID=1247726 RepID=W0PH95_ADVMD|nr:FCD domain-containing protein [Advenella mimigardefordensis]AHG64313.1 transcriptional regulator, GntR family [Advenella mimigardefordensis DPN7]
MTSDIPSSSRKTAARAYLQTAAQLRTVIASLQIDAGGRLPSERELAQQLGVSRPTLREALIVLELQDEVEIRIGSGIYVKNSASQSELSAQMNQADTSQAFHPASRHEDPAATDESVRSLQRLAGVAPADDPDDNPLILPARMLPGIAEDSPKEVNQMRYFLESAVAAEAARFMSPDLRKQLRKSLTDMQAAMAQNDSTTNARMADADRLFHTTLAQSTDNQLVMQTITSLFDQRYRPIARSMHRHFDDHQAWLAAMQEHEHICQAIEDRDPLQALAAMQRHLTRAHQRLMTIIG